jgi:hypothetical protein
MARRVALPILLVNLANDIREPGQQGHDTQQGHDRHQRLVRNLH